MTLSNVVGPVDVAPALAGGGVERVFAAGLGGVTLSNVVGWLALTSGHLVVSGEPPGLDIEPCWAFAPSAIATMLHVRATLAIRCISHTFLHARVRGRPLQVGASEVPRPRQPSVMSARARVRPLRVGLAPDVT